MSVVTPRVLVVSESRITRRVVEMTFADQPLQLAVFADGAAAIDDWQIRPPAVLVADIAMQSPDGYTLAAALREQPAGHKAGVILLAGQADVVDDRAVAAVRASSVLRKPLDSHQLIDAVRHALRAGPPVAAIEPASAPGVVPVPEPVAVAVAAAVAVVEPEGPAVAAPAADLHVGADHMALLLGRESALDGDQTIGAWVQDAAGGPPDDGLAGTFDPLPGRDGALRPVETPAVAAALGDTDVDRIAMRVAAAVATDESLRARLEATTADRAAVEVTAAARQVVERLSPQVVTAAAAAIVREIAPALVSEIARAAVREEIARLRQTRVA